MNYIGKIHEFGKCFYILNINFYAKETYYRNILNLNSISWEFC